jgi:hypothetical protein
MVEKRIENEGGLLHERLTAFEASVDPPSEFFTLPEGFTLVEEPLIRRRQPLPGN